MLTYVLCMHALNTYFRQFSTEGSQLFLVTELVTRSGRRLSRVGTIMVSSDRT